MKGTMKMKSRMFNMMNRSASSHLFKMFISK